MRARARACVCVCVCPCVYMQTEHGEVWALGHLLGSGTYGHAYKYTIDGSEVSTHTHTHITHAHEHMHMNIYSAHAQSHRSAYAHICLRPCMHLSLYAYVCMCVSVCRLLLRYARWKTFTH